MGLSTYIIGIKPADEQWRQMKAVWDACNVVGIQPPTEVTDFFDDAPPNEKGVEVEINFNRYDLKDKRNHPAVSFINDDGREFWDVDISKLPADVKIVRFVNSW